MGKEQASNQYQFIATVRGKGQFYVTFPAGVPMEQAIKKISERYPDTRRPDHPFPIGETVELERSDFAKPLEPIQIREKKGKGRPPLNGRWSDAYPACVSCGTTESRYGGHGTCRNCLNRAKRQGEKNGQQTV